MLLEFTTDNYKNFADGFRLSMVPNAKQKDLTWSIQEETANEEVYRALSAAVIYGPNASGKSNLISAMDTFQRIMSRGHVMDGNEQSWDNFAGEKLELLPNRFLAEPKPVSFGIDFIDKGIRFAYNMSINLGFFMEQRAARSVLFESFAVNNVPVYRRRGQDIEFGDLDGIPENIWGDDSEERFGLAQAVARKVHPTDLFLQNGFRTSVSPNLAEKFNDWLAHGLQVICNSQALRFVPKSADDPASRAQARALSEVLKQVSPNSDSAGYLFHDDRPATLCVRLEDEHSPSPHVMSAELFESYGTVRLLGIMPVILEALNTGATLVMDEFDASLHPAISSGIISAFHNDEVNVNKAQLIVNTHNLVHMNSDLFRRDEIHLVEPDWTRHTSDLYTLADFKTRGDKPVRKEEAYMRQYLKEAYGAYPNIDMHDLLEALMDESGTHSKNEQTELGEAPQHA